MLYFITINRDKVILSISVFALHGQPSIATISKMDKARSGCSYAQHQADGQLCWASNTIRPDQISVMFQHTTFKCKLFYFHFIL